VIPLSSTPAGTTFRVRVVPRAGRTEVAGVRGESLLVRLAAAPVEGAANDALVSFLAGCLDCARRDVEVTAGLKSRDKVVRVSRRSREEIAARLLAILPR
jgi:uncharacterized protein